MVDFFPVFLTVDGSVFESKRMPQNCFLMEGIWGVIYLGPGE